MTDWTIIISTIVGALVAGLVGLFSTYMSRYLDRKERHLNEHKDNFALIGRAIDDLCNEIWPLYYGAEQLKLGHLKHISPESLRLGIIGVPLFNPKHGDNPEEIVRVDKDLYKDMSKHFNILTNKLEKYDGAMGKDGLEMSKLLVELSERIYSEMYVSEFPVLKWTFDKGGKALLRDFKDQLEEQEYAGVIFLLVIRQEKSTWPQTFELYERYGLYKGLNEIANKIRGESEDKVNKMIKLLSGIDKLKEECHDLLEKEKHSFKLKGRCECVKF